jgi:hypothetical protein
MVKAILYVKTDVEGRRLGYRTGLDTLIVLAENDECHKLDTKMGRIQVILYPSILFGL